MVERRAEVTCVYARHGTPSVVMSTLRPSENRGGTETLIVRRRETVETPSKRPIFSWRVREGGRCPDPVST